MCNTQCVFIFIMYAYVPHAHTYCTCVYKYCVYIYLYIDCTQTLTQSTYIYIYVYIYIYTYMMIKSFRVFIAHEWVPHIQNQGGSHDGVLTALNQRTATIGGAWAKCHAVGSAAGAAGLSLMSLLFYSGKISYVIYIYVQTYNIIYHNTYIKYIHLQHVSPSNHIRNDSEW